MRVSAGRGARVSRAGLAWAELPVRGGICAGGALGLLVESLRLGRIESAPLLVALDLAFALRVRSAVVGAVGPGVVRRAVALAVPRVHLWQRGPHLEGRRLRNHRRDRPALGERRRHIHRAIARQTHVHLRAPPRANGTRPVSVPVSVPVRVPVRLRERGRSPPRPGSGSIRASVAWAAAGAARGKAHR
eukprot:4157839-Prymnesium_polylepis.1